MRVEFIGYNKVLILIQNVEDEAALALSDSFIVDMCFKLILKVKS